MWGELEVLTGRGSQVIGYRNLITSGVMALLPRGVAAGITWVIIYSCPTVRRGGPGKHGFTRALVYSFFSFLWFPSASNCKVISRVHYFTTGSTFHNPILILYSDMNLQADPKGTNLGEICLVAKLDMFQTPIIVLGYWQS